MNYFWFKKNLQTSITMPRVHDQLYPNFVFAETRFPTEVVNGLISLGHKVCRCVYIEKSVSDEYQISGLAFALRPRKLAPLSFDCAKSVQSIFQLSDKSNSGLRWCYFTSLSDYWKYLILSFPRRKCSFSPASKRASPRLFACFTVCFDVLSQLAQSVSHIWELTRRLTFLLHLITQR